MMRIQINIQITTARKPNKKGQINLTFMDTDFPLLDY